MNKPQANLANSPYPRSRASGERGSVLIPVLTVIILLSIGLGTYLNSLANIERLQNQRVLGDRALMAAEAGLANSIVQLQGMGTPPAADTVWNIALPSAQFAPFQSVAVNVYPRVIAGQATWTLASTATSAAGTRAVALNRRVQTTLFQANFARYEYFVNDFGGVWSPGYLQFEGFNSVFLGPYHVNSGVAFWPNLWMVNETTTAAPGGVRYFPDPSTYISNVYGHNEANDYVNILQYFNDEFRFAPQFYKGLNVLPQPISLPADMNVDVRATQLRNNAGLKLPADYPGYDSSKGPNFAIDLVTTGAGNGNGQVQVKQYLGQVNGAPTYGPNLTLPVNSINNAMIVYGNIKSLQGTLDGKLTIGAFRSPSVPDSGAVDITGSIEYNSRKAISNFSYTDDPGLYTADGSGINQSYVNTLLGQLDHVTDVLGIVSEADVMIKERDLKGNLVAADVSNPIHLDAIVMATGASSASPTDGGYGVENFKTRAKGAALTVGGAIQNYGLSWALYSSGGQHTNGILATRLWDQRAIRAGGAPPFFPSTGNYQQLGQSWRSSYVQYSTSPPWLPTAP